ncbi:TldD/PmbA family protein [Spirosoma endophyticum]|uniref:Predicted Zn-dependent protease or its inactivated homolog n=1 Tax=Spirosoma endophyticum TaxID=662367 RepID=A0A1I2FL02_9BACT|nr:TldD/PmbA family protein [Spirosoma endophyticum]SFF05713.1 Predicted Zn-dependent protease or its inactivated homolog [Spirosoma endophyticum]
MAILTKEEAKKILDKVLSYSKADEMSASLSGNRTGNIRYARNSVSTSGESNNLGLSVTAVFGKKSGTATINEFDDAALEKTVRRAEEIARLAPENSEYMPMLGPQNYLQTNTYSESTAKIDPEFRANAAFDSIDPCRKNNLTAAGYMEDTTGFVAIGNSKGLFGYNRETNVDFSITVRTADGLGSGYANPDVNDVSKLDTKATTQIAMQKAQASASARAIEPGKYTVILEPTASVELLQNMMRSMDARNADEGRSFLSKKGGGTRLGEKLFDERVTIITDPMNADLPLSPFGGGGGGGGGGRFGGGGDGLGLPQEKRTWIENGVVKNMFYSRFWADKKGVKPIPPAGGFIMMGGTQSLADLIKSTDKGILVTRFWYIRAVDPQTQLYTGLTRDGTFYIENGQIKFPIKNFRFNESPVIMLNNVEALGKPVRAGGNMIPPMKIRDFTFTSLSDAV